MYFDLRSRLKAVFQINVKYMTISFEIWYFRCNDIAMFHNRIAIHNNSIIAYVREYFTAIKTDPI